MFCWRQQERKLDVFFSAKKDQDVRQGEVQRSFWDFLAKKKSSVLFPPPATKTPHALICSVYLNTPDRFVRDFLQKPYLVEESLLQPFLLHY
jgi:hypothetical protein